MNKIKITGLSISKLTVTIFTLFLALQLQAQRTFVFLDNCDSANEWMGLSQLTVNTTDQKEGTGCLQTTGDGGEQKFRKAFSTPVDLTLEGNVDITDAVLSFWFYVSDISFITSRGQIEISSGGKADENEWSWYFEPSAIKQGWNQYTFDLSNHMTYGGDANMTAINWFRIYFFTNDAEPGAANVIYRLDDIRVTNKALVRIRNLSVKENTPGAKISWEALSRTTGGQYEIEHSTNGSNYTSLAIIPEKDGNMPMAYEYVDARNLSGMNYYRLKYFTADETVVLGTGYVTLQGGDNYQSIVGKVITGYQGWFNTPGDGGTNSWVHWSGSGAPRASSLTFEVYPNISEYNDGSLYQTGFADFGDGRKAKLFSSYKEDVINTHFKWMKEYEIDGAAMQRFRTNDNTLKRHRDSVTVRAARAAIKYDRMLYVMYDTDASSVQSFKDDWLHLVNDLKITQYSSYARQNGKPVVCIWGFGFDHRSNSPTNSLEIINWLKNDMGCYVVGGVPAGWRNLSGNSHPGYANVYRAFNMISPWIVGNYSTMQSIDSNKDRLRLDMEECQKYGIDYQPVAYPGFAWSQWKTGPNDVPNQQPRRAGEFFWKQLYNIRTTGIPNLYLAMFDEYDEGTAFMKNATDWSEIPTDQYFLTASADGYWLSSDFQLRMAREASRVMKGAELLTENVTVPHSLGPVYYRNSFEKRSATYSGGVSGIFNLDPCFLNAVRISQSGVATGTAVTNEESQQARSGLYIARIVGNAANATASSYYHKFGEAKIEITENMTLTFWKHAVNEKGLNISLSLQFNDGTYLHTTNLTDKDGIGVNPANTRGQVGAWTKHDIVIGQGELIGKSITALVIGYEGTGTGSFEAYFDDILIWIDGSVTGIPEIKSAAMQFYPTVVQDGYITFNTMQAKDKGLLTVSIYNMQGTVVQRETVRPATVETLQVNLPQGFYVVSVTGNETNVTGKIIIK